MIEHHNVVNMLIDMRSRLQVDASTRLLGTAPVIFDISVLEFLLPLTAGATVLFVEPGVERDAERLKYSIDQLAPTLIQATPATWQMLIDAQWEGSGRIIGLCGGEKLGNALASRILQRVDTLWNVYGPTETTVWSTAHQVTNPPDGSLIGRPISNTQVYLLDLHREPVPAGAAGELYIGGEGVGRGYLNPPQGMPSPFQPDPFAAKSNARMYRTGDQARWHGNGLLQFLGRNDHQVKLRGLRIELSEIESAMETHPAVRQSVALVREDSEGDQRLVAYLLGETVPRAEMLEHLAQQLPAYMIPSAFVTVPTFPLNANGKVDRSKLPPPQTSTRAVTLPSNGIETELAIIWAGLLNERPVSADDDFFTLGGNSLLATRLSASIEQHLHVRLPLSAIFEAPRLADMARRISEHRRSAKSTSFPLEPMVGDELAMSFAQRALWFLDQLEDSLLAYNMSGAWRLRGELDTAALERALQAVVDRHEPLRTVYQVHKGEPRALPAPASRLRVQPLDLQDCPDTEIGSEALRFAREEAHRPFDLTKDLPIRATLLCFSTIDHVLLLTQHHIASDGWSLRVLWEELAKYYVASCENNLSAPSPLPIRYSDYVQWQKTSLNGENRERLATYWKTQLRGLDPTPFPTDHPRPARPSYRGGALHFEWPSEFVEKLRILGEDNRLTPQMTFLSAFLLMLSRYVGHNDIAIGMPVSGRTHAQLESLIGQITNLLVIRNQVDPRQGFHVLMGQVRRTVLAAHDHQEMPFELLVELVQPERHLDRHPLVQVFFDFASTDTPSPLGLVETERLPQASEYVRADIELIVRERAQGGVKLSLLYQKDLFSISTIERMALQLQALVGEALENPEQPLSTLALPGIDPQSSSLLRPSFVADNGVEAIGKQFQAQAARTPEATALIFRGEPLSYAALSHRVQQLAFQLDAMEPAPLGVVAVRLERSPTSIIAALAVMHLGGTYLPLPASTPEQRLQLTLRDAGAQILVTERALEPRPMRDGVSRLYLDEWEPGLGKPNPSILQPVQDLSRPAYAIYTSGSTGVPNGVEVTQEALAQHIKGMQARLEITPADRVLQMTSLAFDPSIEQIFLALTSGATLVLAPERTWMPTEFTQQLVEHGITVADLSPAFFELWVNSLLSEDELLRRSELRTLLIGGEALPVRTLENWRRKAKPGVQVFNAYGPTEAVITATLYEVPEDTTSGGASVPIGRPLPGRQAYVLDPHGHPTALGQPGELYLGGILARGYLGKPDLTGRAFARWSFGDESSTLLFRTGDEVLLLEDGNLEFLRRMDRQVKLRGFRVELGDIEQTLSQHDSVTSCGVRLLPQPNGGKQLVAYVSGTDIDIPLLRSFLLEHLPAYMLPALFIELESLPLDAEGRIDETELLSQGRLAQSRPRKITLPRNETEKVLRDIWRELLGLDQIDIHDNFFELGGHSLMAVRMLSAIEERLGLELPLATLFELSSIAELASELRGLAQTGYATNGAPVSCVLTPRVEPLEPTPGTPKLSEDIYLRLQAYTRSWQGERASSNALLVGTHIQGQRVPLFWCFQYFEELHELSLRLGEEQPLYGMRSGHLVMDYSRDNRLALATHYTQEILAVRPAGPYILGGNCQGGNIAWEIAQQLLSSGREVALLCLLDKHIPRAYPGRIAYLFGSGSELNPYLRFHDPHSGWQRIYGKGASIDLLPWRHGEYFTPPNSEVLADLLRKRMAESLKAISTHPLPHEACEAGFQIRDIPRFHAGQQASLEVQVKNLSRYTWPTTERGGIQLANHWLDEQGQPLTWLDGGAPLADSLEPGTGIQLRLTVRAPEVPGRYLLALDMVESGIRWFEEEGNPVATFAVEVG
jgi:amino acid adenylation domain-containing protein